MTDIEDEVFLAADLDRAVPDAERLAAKIRRMAERNPAPVGGVRFGPLAERMESVLAALRQAVEAVEQPVGGTSN